MDDFPRRHWSWTSTQPLGRSSSSGLVLVLYFWQRKSSILHVVPYRLIDPSFLTSWWMPQSSRTTPRRKRRRGRRDRNGNELNDNGDDEERSHTPTRRPRFSSPKFENTKSGGQITKTDTPASRRNRRPVPWISTKPMATRTGKERTMRKEQTIKMMKTAETTTMVWLLCVVSRKRRNQIVQKKKIQEKMLIGRGMSSSLFWSLHPSISNKNNNESDESSKKTTLVAIQAMQ